MLEFFGRNFSSCVWLAVIIVAMIPTVESKVAIPFGMAVQIWQNSALNPFLSALYACIGSMIPVIFVIMLARYIKRKTSGFVYEKVFLRLKERYKKNSEALSKQTSTLKKCILLAFFVAVPLPLTGAYSGAVVAGFTDIPIWKSFLSIFCGEIVSCAVVLLLCLVFENSAFYIFLISLVMIAVFLFVNALIFVWKSVKNKRAGF